ncbi:S10 family peptidase [Euzebya tangerina]|uniref:S10 family peptidase n=1 Tax=Euzebya tangerina TaxID=591198 RepID=UPI000E31BA17|nr:peptidase S10 [Euzebya tangerina]
MADHTHAADPDARPPVTPTYEPPGEARTTLNWSPPDGEALEVQVTAGWTVLRRGESPSAEIFSTAYVVASDHPRPVTFVFNGGPGASSAFLHLGAIGPLRVSLPDDGSLPAMPIQLVDNDESWLGHTDLVFVDPAGTGFSRLVRRPSAGGRDDTATDPDGLNSHHDDDDRYYRFGSDVAGLREFISRWLSTHRRWSAPVFIAGESYGGYRVGRLAKALQEEEGVGVAGIIAISPALELTPLTATDYSLEAFIDTLPTMAASALHHGRSRAAAEGATADEVMAQATDFATGQYVSYLASGAAMPEEEREAVLDRLGDLIGLDAAVVRRHHGRITLETFARELLRDQGLAVGLYDTTQTTVDPFGDRDGFGSWPDATLSGSTPAFTMAVNQMLRERIGVETQRRYELISMDVNARWKPDADAHALETPAGATDDLRYGLALNPHMRVLIVHGRHDLVTPAHHSQRLVNLMRLDPTAAERLSLARYDGGHMFYTLAESRRAFTADAVALIEASLA